MELYIKFKLLGDISCSEPSNMGSSTSLWLTLQDYRSLWLGIILQCLMAELSNSDIFQLPVSLIEKIKTTTNYILCSELVCRQTQMKNEVARIKPLIHFARTKSSSHGRLAKVMLFQNRRFPNWGFSVTLPCLLEHQMSLTKLFFTYFPIPTYLSENYKTNKTKVRFFFFFKFSTLISQNVNIR